MSLVPRPAAAIILAEQADPSNGRCLIENCAKERGVEAIDVLPRDCSSDSLTVSSFNSSTAMREKSITVSQMDTLEYCWKMCRGTLNLDSRCNIFFGMFKQCFVLRPSALNFDIDSRLFACHNVSQRPLGAVTGKVCR